MARRFSAPYQQEPVSGLATWSRNLAIFSVVAVLVSIIIVRFGFLEVKPALATFFGALGLAGLSILLGLAAFAAIWQNGTRGMGRILLAFLIDAAILGYPAYLTYQYRKLPRIYDVTTDAIDPPKFEALARLRTGEGTNPAAYAGLYSAEKQRAAYPDIETVELETPVDRGFQLDGFDIGIGRALLLGRIEAGIGGRVGAFAGAQPRQRLEFRRVDRVGGDVVDPRQLAVLIGQIGRVAEDRGVDQEREQDPAHTAGAVLPDRGEGGQPEQDRQAGQAKRTEEGRQSRFDLQEPEPDDDDRDQHRDDGEDGEVA